MSPSVDIFNSTTLFGISYKVVAFESVLFIQNSFKSMKEDLKNLLTREKEKNLNEFYTRTIDLMDTLVLNLLKLSTYKFIGFEQLNQQIGNNKWDTKEAGIEHSSYVDFLLKEFGNMSKKLNQQTDNFGLPKRLKNTVWEQILKLTMEQLVESYSKIKKCTNVGFAIMSLDIKTFQNGVEKMTSLRPIPMIQYVDNYIKAYYISTESDFLNWVKEHPEYTSKRLIGLVHVLIGTNLKKQSKQSLVTAIEEIVKERKGNRRIKK